MRRAKEIIPGKLYQATTTAKWPDGKLEWLKENVDLVVILCNRGDDDLDSDDSLAYWHRPVPDSHKVVTPEILEEVVPYVASWIRAEKRVLVCCLAGRSRSGAATTLVVRDLFNLTGSEALDYVRTKRPGAVKRDGPEDYIRSLDRPRPTEPAAPVPS